MRSTRTWGRVRAQERAPQKNDDGTRPSGVYDSPKLELEAHATASSTSRDTGHEAPMQRRKRRPLEITVPTILVVDDDLSVGRAWLRWLRAKFDVYPAVHAINLSQARAALVGVPALAVVLDIGLGSEDGLTLLREMRENGDVTPVIVVTGDHALSIAGDVAGLGASIAYKPVENDHLARFVERSIAVPRTLAVATALLAIETELTTREAEVFAALLRHQSTKEIAEALDISAKSVKTSTQAVLDRFGVDSRLALHQLVMARLGAN